MKNIAYISFCLLLLVPFENNAYHRTSVTYKEEPSLSRTAWVVIGSGVGLALGAFIGSLATQKSQEYREREHRLQKERDCYNQQQREKRSRMALQKIKTHYVYELHWDGHNPIAFFKNSVFRMEGNTADANAQYADDLKQTIAELEEALLYLYGPEHDETQELIKQLQQLYASYMEFFGKQVEYEKAVRWQRERQERERYEQEQYQRREKEVNLEIKRAQLERTKQETKLAKKQRKLMKKANYGGVHQLEIVL